MEHERWKPIESLRSEYEASSLGRIRSAKNRTNTTIGRVLTPRDVRGYMRVNTCVGGVAKGKFVHRLVAEAFIGPIPDGNQVNHINGDKSDNKPENLEYTTPTMNTYHAISTGLRNFSGEGHWASRLSDGDISEIRLMRGVVSGVELAKRFGVSTSQISKIQLGQSWRRV